MSDLITGTHLQPDNLNSQNIVQELDRFGQWTRVVEFQSLSNEVKKCMHKDRERMLGPVLRELGYKIEVCNLHAQSGTSANTLQRIKYQILRVESRAYIDADAPAYLIPIRIQETASGTVYDTSTSPVKLAVGQRVYFKDPIIVEPGVDFLLITAR
jgi:hypothetical protein